MHPDDLRLLLEIKNAPKGFKVFKPRPGQSDNDFDEEVERVIALRRGGLITMRPDPMRSSRGDGHYLLTGECRLTLEGREALARDGHG